MHDQLKPDVLRTDEYRALLPPAHAALLVDASVDAAAIVDREQRVIYSNASYVKLSGLPVREFKKQRLEGMCHNHFKLKSCADGGCIALRAIHLKRSIRVDEVESERDDSKFIITAVPLLDASGEVSYVIENYRDVTAEHRMQENYKRLLELEVERNKILQQEVDKRTKELKEALEQVSILARTDALTGLHNRRYFDEHFELELKRAQRFNHSLALVVFDLDRFKLVNDQHGHAAGDEVLRRFGELAKRESRSTDVLARLGGEEFGLLLLEAGAEEAIAVAERLRISQDEQGLLTTVSAGVATIPPHGPTRAELFGAADRALYDAKAKGRNRVEVARGAQ